MLRLSRNFLEVAALAALVCGACACSDLKNCPASKPDITIDTGVTDTEAKTYQSAPWWGPRDAFPAQTNVHFKHQLGFTPEVVQSMVSFSAASSDLSENAGNQGEWMCVDDEEFVVRNGTCQDFFIVVSAYGSGNVHAPCKCAERDGDGNCPK